MPTQLFYLVALAVLALLLALAAALHLRRVPADDPDAGDLPATGVREDGAPATRAQPFGTAERSPNDFEAALLKQFALEHPALLPHIDQLHVRSREYTGYGSFTRFETDVQLPALHTETLAMAADLHVPACPTRVLALLHCSNGQPHVLESSTVDRWEGAYEGFTIGPLRRAVAERGANEIAGGGAPKGAGAPDLGPSRN